MPDRVLRTDWDVVLVEIGGVGKAARSHILEAALRDAATAHARHRIERACAVPISVGCCLTS